MGIFAKGFIAGAITGVAAVFTAAVVSVIHEDYVCRNTVVDFDNLDYGKEENESDEQENSASEVADATSENNLEDA